MTGPRADIRLLIPLYVHPAVEPEAWQAVAAAGPDRVAGVVLNIADGPGPAPDHAFTAAAEKLHRSGIPVLGYADTAYGARGHAEVVTDLLNHREWYGVDGVYFDQVSADPGALPHYRRLVTAARAAGCGVVVLGHGSHPDPQYADVGLADCLVTFEGDWTDYQELEPPVWTRRHPAARFCHLVYDVPESAAAQVGKLAAAHGAGLGCASPAGGENPWSALPFGIDRAPLGAEAGR
ncbi:spherulation-specific family 4 protein [Kitasatospora paranensis]|uniref:Spherulation-specific family 4 protein n=1 Tax=Kitasatospora paranensis TaxID=258053 RepID=A0ABW2FU18_9ACTN